MSTVYWRDKVQEDVDRLAKRYTNSISKATEYIDVEAIEIEELKYAYEEAAIGQEDMRAGNKYTLREEPGGSTPSQYALPPGAKELIDLIEHRYMNFSIGNIFKAAYRMGNCNHADKLYDLRKIIFFAQRELDKELKVKM